MKSLGIDLGGHYIKGALVERGSITRRERIPTPPGRDPESIVAAISEMIRKLGAGRPAYPAGIGFPGMLDRERGTVLQAPNFPLLENFHFRDRVQEASGGKIFIENDANCAALGEMACGAALGLTDFVMFTLGTGIGGAIVSGGRLIAGSHGRAGEMGHIPVGGGTLCGCGAPGHAEAYFGADALGRSFAKEGIEGDLPGLWIRRAEPDISLIWEIALDTLARAVAAAIHMFDPQAVILGGGLSRGSGFIETLSPVVLKYTAPPFRKTLVLKISTLGDDAAILGAASLTSSWLPDE